MGGGFTNDFAAEGLDALDAGGKGTPGGDEVVDEQDPLPLGDGIFRDAWSPNLDTASDRIARPNQHPVTMITKQTTPPAACRVESADETALRVRNDVEVIVQSPSRLPYSTL